MSDTSLILSLPYILPSQAQKHVTHNEALRILDILVQPAVQDRGLTAPPASPAAGGRHIIGSGAQGDWAGQDNRIALWTGQAWQFLAPQAGWRAFVLSEGADVIWTGANWEVLVRLSGEWPMLGVATAPDATNRLAVAAPATLLTHAGAGHQLKVNKATASDTASLLFQSGWSGRAEMGLAGSDDFTLKVSPDGSTFHTALQAARATGAISLPQGVSIGGLVTGAAVQSGPADATAGRLMPVGAFGLGGLAPMIGNAGVTDNSIAPGFYTYDTTATSSGGPAGVQRGLMLHLRRAAGGGETQILVAETGLTTGIVAGLSFSRARTAGAWGAWFCGGITESGSNANGRYLRQQDGTQICWQPVTTLTGGEATAIFPAAFSTTTGLMTTLGVNASAVIAISPRFTGRTVTGCSVSAFNASNARVATQVEMVTMGRWY